MHDHLNVLSDCEEQKAGFLVLGGCQEERSKGK